MTFRYLALAFFSTTLFAAECTITPAAADTTLTGTLAVSDCKINDFFPGFVNSNAAKVYSLNVTRRQVLIVKLESARFDSLLYIANSSRAAIAFNDNIATGVFDSQVTISLDPGLYYIAATAQRAAAPGLGDYRLTAQSSELRPCPIRELVLGETAASAIADTDCRVLDFTPLSSNVRSLHRYSLTVAKRAVYTFSMKSTNIDSLLILVDSAGLNVASDDNGGGLADALLTVSLNPGSYVLQAGARQAPFGGDYTLKATVEEPRPCPVKDLASGQTDTGSLIDAFGDFGRRRALFSDDDIRRYAVEKLDFARKIESMIT